MEVEPLVEHGGRGWAAMEMTCAGLPNKLVSAANGVDYAYREAGDSGVPLVLLQHFRGNLDSWDRALIDALASGWRRRDVR
jgi:hypothetical protein